MTENQTDFSEAGLIELTSTQRQVIEILRSTKSQKYPLADCYLGAIYAARNIYNPDRHSQAAQSLRELLEKLPRVFFETEIHGSKPDFPGMRNSLYSRLSSDKRRYDGAWKGKKIDAGLDKTIRNMDRYLELNQMPTRKEQIHSVMNKLDPMHGVLDQGIKLDKSERFHNLWKIFEGLAHHRKVVDDNFFWKQLSLVEHLIIDLLAPITAQDQGAIKKVLEKSNPNHDDFEKILELIKRRGANYVFFFKNVDSPAWLTPLVQNGFFQNLPKVEATESGQIRIPVWWPIFFLKKVCAQKPEQVVEILLNLEKTDNPAILREIFAIACDLPDVAYSLRLKPLIKRFLQSPYRWGENELIVNLLQRWGHMSGQPFTAALEIAQYVAAFQPDPQKEEKRTRCKENPGALNTSPKPTPRFHQWGYQKILEEAVRPLAVKEPYRVARILLDATASMIRMSMHPEDFDKRRDQDYSEIWCRRLNKSVRDFQDTRETLVHTLTYACEQVYDKVPEFIEALDQVLRKQRWKVFRRLRQHLYALHPNDQTLPWIRELLLGHEDYSNWEYHYEFQLMIRKASEYFGSRLLSEAERADIFDVILSGPSKEDFREWMGDAYSEEAFQKRQRYFQRMQLRPFATLLSGAYRRYFEKLESEEQKKVISDESYSPYQEGNGGFVTYQSPKSVEDLERLTDHDLLTYLNEWDEEHRDRNNWLIEIKISALADVFQSLFKTRIVSQEERLAFWMACRDNIARPIYVASMVKAMQELIKAKIFDNLNQWIEFCAWILSHPDSDRVEGQPEPQDESGDNPDWGSSRRAVVDFIDTCLKKDVDAPITARDGFANLIQEVWTQFDWRLDRDQPVLLNRDQPIAEAINNTRSRAIMALVNFGFWVRRHLPEDPVLEMTEIISTRVSEAAEIPLTRPEYALLGMHFGNLCVLNRDWATEQKRLFFPQDDEPVWRDAFRSFLRYNQPLKLTFDILRADFELALEHLSILEVAEDSDKGLVDRLGQHLFTYYLWQAYPLSGDESLLARFYEKTCAGRQYWANLFDHIGRSLRKSDKHLDKGLVGRVIAYFDWRLDVAEPLELQQFTFWLEAECLEPEWRLRSYSKTLDLGRGKDMGIFTEMKSLNKLLPDHLPLVVECFAKITDALGQDNHLYISGDEAIPILKAGLKAEDSQVFENAERAKENLLRIGRFDFLDM